jgi:2-amino-4-hydroxy-6-hydroxymethyldihydropteridine diphosphokinase
MGKGRFMPSISAYVALGGNLGDRAANLDGAVRELGSCPGVRVRRVSTYHETGPSGGPVGQPPYLNAAAQVETDLGPEALLEILLAVESRLGRTRAERNAPRTIDLDLLLYGDVVIATSRMVVPHPRMHERLFVLAPLAEIAPDAVHPTLGLTVRELLDAFREQASAGKHQGRELTGMKALVTGSTSGIGRAIAVELASAGADVLIHGRRLAAAEETTDLVQAQRVRTHWSLADLRRPEECARLVELAWKEWGGLDVWVNNAGADTLTGEAASWPFERKWEELLSVDVNATMFLSRTIGQRMKEQGRGVILNMGWDQAETGMEGESGQLFGAAKGAVMAFTKSLALALAPEVRVNCLAPGWIRTAWGEGASRSWQERVLRETPLGRWGTAEDVARAVRWLASPAAAYVTGQVIRLNGGAVR